MPFKPGASGNPRGRPKGAKNKMTERARELLYNNAEEITAKCIELALEGDIQAIKIVMERIMPVKREIDMNHAVTDIEESEIIVKFVSPNKDEPDENRSS